MATANQLKTLIKSHFEDNSEKFNTVALQIAAHEAKLGHTNLANDIRKIIDAAKINKPKLKNIETVMASQSDLVDIIGTFQPRIVRMDK